MLVGVPVTALTIAAGAYLAGRGSAAVFEQSVQHQFSLMSQRAAQLVNRYMSERQSDVLSLVRIPDVVRATLAANDEAQALGLERSSTDVLEQRYADQRALSGNNQALSFLTTFRDSSDFREVFFTERLGLNVWTTNRTSDFVQSDEDWWRMAWESGWYQGEAAYDESAGVVGVELAARIDNPASGEPIGVLKVILDLSGLSQLLSGGSLTEQLVKAIDREGRLILSNDPSRLFTLADNAQLIPREPDATVVLLPGIDGGDLAASTPANSGSWWVVVRQPLALAYGPAQEMRTNIYLAAAAILVIALLFLLWLTEWLHRRVTQPVHLAGTVAQRIADGDLSVGVAGATAESREVRHLMGSVRKMVDSIRKLVAEMRTSSHESAAMAEQISAATEEMSASTQEMANTCQDLSSQATEQAELARQSADDAGRILSISTTLADGANVAAERSTVLANTASEHRERLIEGGKQLAQLASDLERGAADAERLAASSQEIQQFLTQSKSIATQTNMLALNAAIEASRAASGEGRGFAVVADEVRKLANQAARSAATTSDIVRSVLTTVQETQNRLSNLAQASTAVRQVAESAAGALEEVAGATAESSAWSDEISRAAGEVNKLVEDITGRLQAIAHGTESVVAASEEIAASAEEQSASTEQIAASASQLADAADRLTMTVNSFRLTSGGETGNEPASRTLQPGTTPS
jgi:methyl-accepting chemotaxis protein